jgi:DNA polymerase-3 subunit delta
MPTRLSVLHGLDEFAIGEHIDRLKASVSADPGTADLNIQQYDGRSVTLREVQAACGALPFLADTRLVLVAGWLTRLTGKSEDPDGAGESSRARAELTALVEYLPNIPPTTHLVLAEARELSDRNPLLKAAARLPDADIQRFDVPQGDGLVKWITARAKAVGGSITPDAARALASAEDDPRALCMEIDKLLAYANYARPIAVEDVQALTPTGSEARIWDFVDHLGQRRPQLALRELHLLLEHEEPLYVLAMITRQFRHLLQAREIAAARGAELEVARALGIPTYPAGKALQQARAFSLPQLEASYRRLLDCDVDIKTGRLEPTAALDVLVTELTQ